MTLTHPADHSGNTQIQQYDQKTQSAPRNWQEFLGERGYCPTAAWLASVANKPSTASRWNESAGQDSQLLPKMLQKNTTLQLSRAEAA